MYSNLNLNTTHKKPLKSRKLKLLFTYQENLRIKHPLLASFEKLKKWKTYSLRTPFTSQNKSKSENLDRLSNKTLEFPEGKKKEEEICLGHTAIHDRVASTEQ